METKHLTANYQTSTGYRFISEGTNAYKVSIHLPDDTYVYSSIGFVTLGKKAALRKAIKTRNELGHRAWGKFWRRVLKEHDLIISLPHNLEPKLSKCGTYYAAYWSDENKKRKCRKRSVEKYGKLAAYMQCKRVLLDAHRKNLELLLFMDRLSTIDLK